MRVLSTLLAVAALAGIVAMSLGQSAPTAPADSAPAATASAPAAAATTQTSQTIDLPSVGLSLSLPDNLQLRSPGEPFDVLKAVDTTGKANTLTVTISAFPVAANKSAEDSAADMLKEFDRNLAIRNLTVRKTLKLSVAGLDGVVQLISYGYRGINSTAARMYFARDVQKDMRLCYVLTADATADREAEIMPILVTLVHTLKTTEVRSPTSAPAQMLAQPISDVKSGFALRLPQGWHYAFTRPGTGVAFAATDYLQGGVAAPTGNVVVMDTGGQKAQDMAKRMVENARRGVKATDVKIEIRSQGAVTMGGLDGYEFVLRESAVKALSDGKTERPVTVVQRTICRKEANKSYTLVLFSENSDEASVRSVADKLTEGFELITMIEAASAPAAPGAAGTGAP